MTSDVAKTRLCELVTKVGGEVFKHEYPHDCFCDLCPNPANAEIAEQVVAHIERCVDAMAMIVNAMDGTEWNADTVEMIADIVRGAGFDLNDPA